MTHRHAARVFAILITLAVVLGSTRSALADRVADLARVLSRSKKEKQRISAAVALGRLRDKRGTRPLVHALIKDPSALVRAVAAAALGHLGDDRALPALRRALKDDDSSVRKRAREAAARIEQRTDDRKVSSGTITAADRANRRRQIAVAAREPPRLGIEPSIFVQIKSVADDSRDRASKRRRQWRAASVRDFMLSELRRTPEITLDAERADQLGIRKFSVDVSIIKVHRRVRGPWLEIECSVRVSVSNDRGRMLSFLTGGATVQVPRRKFDTRYENKLRREAMENAAKNVHQDLVSYLSREMRL